MSPRIEPPMANPALQIPPDARVVYVVERQPAPAPAAHEPHNPQIEKIKTIVGKILLCIGATLLIAALISIAGHAIGFLAIGAATAEMLFTTSIVALISGFYLANPLKSKPDAMVGVGPLWVSV